MLIASHEQTWGTCVKGVELGSGVRACVGDATWCGALAELMKDTRPPTGTTGLGRPSNLNAFHYRYEHEHAGDILGRD